MRALIDPALFFFYVLFANFLLECPRSRKGNRRLPPLIVVFQKEKWTMAGLEESWFDNNNNGQTDEVDEKCFM